jgi:hypothetical protein
VNSFYYEKVVTVLYSVQREIGTCNSTLQNAVEYLS